MRLASVLEEAVKPATGSKKRGGLAASLPETEEQAAEILPPGSRRTGRRDAGAPKRKNLAALTGAEAWESLPVTTRARFQADPLNADFEGEGDFEASPHGTAFAFLGVLFGRPLPCATGRAAVTIKVRAVACGEAWTRIYRFGGAQEIVSSIKHAGAGPWLEERAGPLIMRLSVFVDDAALVFECLDFRLRFGRLEIPIPFFLTPGRIRVAHRDLGCGRFLFTLEARHPWFGATFRQRCEMRDACSFAADPDAGVEHSRQIEVGTSGPSSTPIPGWLAQRASPGPMTTVLRMCSPNARRAFAKRGEADVLGSRTSPSANPGMGVERCRLAKAVFEAEALASDTSTGAHKGRPYGFYIPGVPT